MASPRRLLAAALLGLHASAACQTYVVASGGGGQFTSLPQAIQAVPDGATLHVKPGTYSEFTISGKSITMLAETVGTVTVNVNTACTITGLSAAQRVFVSGFTFAAGFLAWNATISVTACAGSVVLDRITLPPSLVPAPPVIAIDQCADLHC